MIVGCSLHLWMYKRVIFGDVANHHVAELDRHQRREFPSSVCWPSARCGWACIRSPSPEVMHASVNDLLRHVAISKIQ